MTEDELQAFAVESGWTEDDKAFAVESGWTEDDIQGYREQLADLAAERHAERHYEGWYALAERDADRFDNYGPSDN